MNWFLQLINPLKGVPSPNDDVLRELAVASAERGADRKRCLFDLLDETYKFVPPRLMVEREFRKVWSALKADRHSWTIELASVDGSERRLKAEFRSIADRRVRLGLILGVIARRVGITGNDYPRGQRAPEVERAVVDYIFRLVDHHPT